MAETLVFDCEGNGLSEYYIDRKKVGHPECDRIHCLVLRSYPDGEVTTYSNNEEGDTIPEGYARLCRAAVNISHNGIQYDWPVLSRLYGSGDPTKDCQGKTFDTLVAARVLWPDAKNHPFGGNSLKAFGKHLGCMKGDYDGGWEAWSTEMLSYCVQDTEVSTKIFDFLKPKLKRFKHPLRLEHRVAEICARMQDNGVSIDVPAAEALADQLDLTKARCLDELQALFPPRVETMKTPEYYKSSVDGSCFTTVKMARESGYNRAYLEPGPMKTKEHPFNPGSAQQVAERFAERYGWEAPMTEAGNPSVTEEVLKGLDYPEAKLILHYEMADKRLQHLQDWITRARNSRTPGRIHPQINTCGAATSRATHQQPNQTACPKVLDPKARGYEGRYGWEMRSLWGPREKWMQVGGDASGLELRLLGAALARWDRGAYAREVVDGDIHTLNQEAGGLPTRDLAKTVTYAYLYGAGNGHLDELIGKRGAGKKFRDRLEAAIPALNQLRTWCAQCASEKGFVPLLDGRHAPIRSEHAALNTYLQGNGAILMKLAMVLCDTRLEKQGLRYGWMLWPHDEFQLEAHPRDAEAVGETIIESIQDAGVALKVACPMTGEYKIGRSWAECH